MSAKTPKTPSLRSLFAGFKGSGGKSSATLDSGSGIALSTTTSRTGGFDTAASILQTNQEHPVAYPPEYANRFKTYPEELELAKTIASKGGLSGWQFLGKKITDKVNITTLDLTDLSVSFSFQ